MREIRITSWSEFEGYVEKMKHREWLFRGQSDSSWKFTTSLECLFKDMLPVIKNARGTGISFAKKDHEKLIIKTFQKNANLYLNFLPDESLTLEWLAIRQHHGAPTRLLDVTLSPHIASYFALEAGAGECCIYAINHTVINKRNTKLLSVNSYKEMQKEVFTSRNKFIVVFDPEYDSERLVVQRGVFLVSNRISEPFEDLLEDYQHYSSDDIWIKFIFPPSLRLRGLGRLREMNIISATLFPGIDGFCKSLRFQVLEPLKRHKLLL